MLPPIHFQNLARYLDGVDMAVISQMVRKFPPDETALTGSLCALMDTETQRRERSLDFDIDALNSVLAEAGDGIDFELRIDTIPHNSTYENRVSQSDFGLIVEYRNKVLPTHDWSKAYLVQAKRVYPSSDNSYGMGSQFAAKDKEQHARIQKLVEILGPHALLYGLYTPPLSLLDPAVRTVGRALHARALANEIFDFAGGLALHNWLTNPKGHPDLGIWFSPPDWYPTSMRGLHERAWSSALPLTWFLLHHFSTGQHGLFRQLWAEHGRCLPDDDWVRDIATGKAEAIEKLLTALDDDADRPNGRVLPAHTITIGITVGRMLSEDDKALAMD